MTRLAVVADPHIDDYGTRIDPEFGLNARFVDSLTALGWVADDARKRGCDALIVAGDFTENRHPAPWRVAMIEDQLRRFAGHHDRPYDGRTILVRGNHDGLRSGLSIVDVLAHGLPNAHGWSRPGIDRVGSTAVCVIPYLDRSWLRSRPGFEHVPDADLFRILAEQYLTIARGLYAEATDDEHVTESVLVVHQSLSGGLMSDTQQAFLGEHGLVVDTTQLAAIGYHAILAGHFHLHQVLHRSPLIAYAGSPYRTDFGEEHQPKGYMVVDTVDPDGFEFVENPRARRFVTLRGDDWADQLGDIESAVVRVLDLDPTADPSSVRAQLEALGAFDVTEVRPRRAERPEEAVGMSEDLTSEQALEAWFDADEDREALVTRGRELLAEALA